VYFKEPQKILNISLLESTLKGTLPSTSWVLVDINWFHCWDIQYVFAACGAYEYINISTSKEVSPLPYQPTDVKTSCISYPISREHELHRKTEKFKTLIWERILMSRLSTVDIVSGVFTILSSYIWSWKLALHFLGMTPTN